MEEMWGQSAKRNDTLRFLKICRLCGTRKIRSFPESVSRVICEQSGPALSDRIPALFSVHEL